MWGAGAEPRVGGGALLQDGLLPEAAGHRHQESDLGQEEVGVGRGKRSRGMVAWALVAQLGMWGGPRCI